VRIAVDGGIGGPVSLAVGPEVLLSIEHAARADGSASSTRLVVGVGAGATAALALAARVALEVRGELDYALPLEMSRYVVSTSNGQQEVLKPPALQAAVTAGVRIGLLP
jgi:hypothetical protein